MNAAHYGASLSYIMITCMGYATIPLPTNQYREGTGLVQAMVINYNMS